MSATATIPTRDRSTGRFATRHRRCPHCGCYLAEDLLGQLRCILWRVCPAYREVVGTTPGVDPGVLGDALGTEPET